MGGLLAETWPRGGMNVAEKAAIVEEKEETGCSCCHLRNLAGVGGGGGGGRTEGQVLWHVGEVGAISAGKCTSPQNEQRWPTFGE